jgi:hypothetical protein
MREIPLTDDITIVITKLDEPFSHLKIELHNKQTGAKIDLASFSKEKLRFVMAGMSFSYDPLTKTAPISLALLFHDPKMILIVLHEVAHSHIFRQSYTPLLKYVYAAKMTYHYKQSEQELKHAKRTLKEERNTWALTMRFVRRLRTQGFDIMKAFKNKQEFDEWFKLNGYDLEYGERVRRLEK